MVTAAVIGSAALGAGASLISSSNAASAQKDASNQASQTQLQMFQQAQQALAPYRDVGLPANNMLTGLAQNTASNPLNAYLSQNYQPHAFTPGDLTQTPGYNFTLDQGLKSVQNGYAAKGLGESGAALKGAARYATGLADQTYQNQFNNDMATQQLFYNTNLGQRQFAYTADMGQRSLISNILLGQLGIGENAAAGTGSAAVNTGTNIGNNIIGAGNASAAGSLAAGNAVGSLPGNALSYYMLAQNSGLFGTNPTVPAPQIPNVNPSQIPWQFSY